MLMSEFKEEHPELFKEATDAGKLAGIAEGKTEGPKRFAAILALVDGDKVLAADCFTASLGDVDCLKKKNEKLAAQLQAANETNATDNSTDDDLATQEFSDDATTAAAKAAANGTGSTKDMTDIELKAQFDASKKLQDEFNGSGEMNCKAYIAYCRSQENGTSKIMGQTPAV
jgi:hypothetical protein